MPAHAKLGQKIGHAVSRSAQQALIYIVWRWILFEQKIACYSVEIPLHTYQVRDVCSTASSPGMCWADTITLLIEARALQWYNSTLQTLVYRMYQDGSKHTISVVEISFLELVRTLIHQASYRNRKAHWYHSDINTLCCHTIEIML